MEDQKMGCGDLLPKNGEGVGMRGQRPREPPHHPPLMCFWHTPLSDIVQTLRTNKQTKNEFGLYNQMKKMYSSSSTTPRDPKCPLSYLVQ